MSGHRFATSFGQCECRWCGRRRDGQDCAINEEMRQALRDFARSNGRTWKSKLHDLWMQGKDEGPLRQVRNIIGPSGLLRLKTTVVLST